MTVVPPSCVMRPPVGWDHPDLMVPRALLVSFHLIPGHPWVAGDQASDKPLGAAVLGRIKNFSAANKMKKLALKVCAIVPLTW